MRTRCRMRSQARSRRRQKTAPQRSQGEWRFNETRLLENTQVGCFLRATDNVRQQKAATSLKSNYKGCARRPLFSQPPPKNAENLALRAAGPDLPMKQQTPAPLRAEEATPIATDAYIFGNPLVTMEMTRRATTNATALQGLHAPMVQFANARTSDGRVPRRDRTERRHTLFVSLARPLERTVCPEPARRAWPHLIFSDAQCVDDGIPGPGHTNYRHWPQNYAITGPLGSGTPQRCNRVQIAN